MRGAPPESHNWFSASVSFLQSIEKRSSDRRVDLLKIVVFVPVSSYDAGLQFDVRCGGTNDFARTTNRVGHVFHDDKPGIAQNIHIALDRASVTMQAPRDDRDRSRLSFHCSKYLDARACQKLQKIFRVLERDAECLCNGLPPIRRAGNAPALRKEIVSCPKSNAQLLHASLPKAIDVPARKHSSSMRASSSTGRGIHMLHHGIAGCGIMARSPSASHATRPRTFTHPGLPTPHALTSSGRHSRTMASNCVP